MVASVSYLDVHIARGELVEPRADRVTSLLLELVVDGLHRNLDTFVVFPALRILHTGDMFAWKDAPLCDRNNGGSCVEMPRTLQKAIAGIKDVDTIIPGHSPMQTPKDLQEYQRFTADLLSHSVDEMKSGKTAEDAAASFKVDKYPGYKNERVKLAVQAVYDELKK